jgi:hypothetical protein
LVDLVRFLIFHGCLLPGTGSNVYNANLAAALRRAGHEVHLFSQDRHPERLDFPGDRMIDPTCRAAVPTAASTRWERSVARHRRVE